jgi:acetate kinase
MKRAVATFNTGSSSLKFSVFEIDDGSAPGECLLRCNLKDLDKDLSIDLAPGSPFKSADLETAITDLDPVPSCLLPALVDYLVGEFDQYEIAGIGHRIVHGGEIHSAACPSDASVLSKLKVLSVFAPDHQPHNLAGVTALQQSHPSLFQSLSFDTSFHGTIPEISRLYAIPKSLSDAGLVRFGFHGLSYDFLAMQAPNILAGHPHSKIVAAHLGSGASLCAIRNGKSVATSMGLTALSGIPMAKRCGDVDPGLILYLMEARGLDHDQISDLLYHKSGLLGISGISGDTRVLLNDESPAAKDAIDHYVERIAREIGSMIVALEGLEAIVFTGGVGENAHEIRRRICQKLHYVGLEIDQKANLANASIISAKTSNVSVAVVKADEEYVLARDTIKTMISARA